MNKWLGIEFIKQYINERFDKLEILLNNCNNIEDAIRINGAISELSILSDFLRNLEI
jgi:hypothetical protein